MKHEVAAVDIRTQTGPWNNSTFQDTAGVLDSLSFHLTTAISTIS